MRDGDLREYARDTTPSIVKKRTIELGPRTVGYAGYDLTNDVRCYTSERDTDEHRYRGADPWYDVSFEGEAYAISEELLPGLRRAGIGRVYIIETDTGRVLMYGLRDFEEGDVINVKVEAERRGYEKDRQRVVPVAESTEVWDPGYPDVYAKQKAFR